MSTPYAKLKVAELKAELTKRDRIPPLSLQGSKAILVARLVRDDNALEGDVASSSWNHKIISEGQWEAAGPSNAIYEWAMMILSSDNVMSPPSATLGAAVDHPDLPIVQALLVETSIAMREMAPPEPPSMMVALEVMKSLIRLEMVDTIVRSTMTQNFLEIFDVNSVIRDEQIAEDAEKDFSGHFLLPAKQALGHWLSATIREFEMKGTATKFPEHFNTKDVATLRAWAKSYIRANNLDISAKFNSGIFQAALIDESLTIERAKSVLLVTTILNQAAAAMNRDQRVRKAREDDSEEHADGQVRKDKARGKKRVVESSSSSKRNVCDSSEDELPRPPTVSARSRDKKKQRLIDSDED